MRYLNNELETKPPKTKSTRLEFRFCWNSSMMHFFVLGDFVSNS